MGKKGSREGRGREAENKIMGTKINSQPQRWIYNLCTFTPKLKLSESINKNISGNFALLWCMYSLWKAVYGMLWIPERCSGFCSVRMV